MSGEGQLLQKIRNKSHVLDADIHRELTREQAREELSAWSDDDEITDEDLTVKVSEVKEIVEEMTQDYPLCRKCGKFSLDNEGNPEQDYFLCSPILKWFLRWLGGPKHEPKQI